MTPLTVSDDAPRRERIDSLLLAPVGTSVRRRDIERWSREGADLRWWARGPQGEASVRVVVGPNASVAEFEQRLAATPASPADVRALPTRSVGTVFLRAAGLCRVVPRSDALPLLERAVDAAVELQQGVDIGHATLHISGTRRPVVDLTVIVVEGHPFLVQLGAEVQVETIDLVELVALVGAAVRDVERSGASVEHRPDGNLAGTR